MVDTFNLRHVGSVELAADGSRVSREETRMRGLLAVGLELRKEREADDRAGRKHRRLRGDELRALQALVETEISGDRG